jgi:hypothetical protein
MTTPQVFCPSLDCSQCYFTGECRRVTSDESKKILGVRAGRFDIAGIHDRNRDLRSDAVEILHQEYHHDQTLPSCPRSTLGARTGGSCRIKAGVLCFGACVCLPISGTDCGDYPKEHSWYCDTGTKGAV